MAIAGAPGVAHAGGFEYAGAGARGLARGGANLASVSDPMAVLLNPANLAGPVRGLQLHLSASNAFNNVCFQRDGTWTDDPLLGPGARNTGFPTTSTIYGDFSDYANRPLPEVCNSQKFSPIPELAISWRVNERFGLGFGIVVPSAVGFAKYGGTHDGHAGTIAYAGSPTGYIPAPSRYMLTDAKLLLAFPTLSFGVDLLANHPGAFRLGGAIAAGTAMVGFKAFSQPIGGEDFSTDLYTRITASDYFVPRATLSLAGTSGGLDWMASFTYQGDINAKGHLDISGDYNIAPADRGPSDVPSIRINGTSIKAHQPWQAYAGVRYRSLFDDRETRPRRFDDDVENLRWDLELALGYEINSRVKQFDVQIHQLPDYPQVTVNPGTTAGVPPTPRPILHHWKNQVAVRVGGDYAIVPGRLLWSGGVSFDSNGVEKGYAQIDFQPFRRVGLHTGFLARIGRTDLTLAAVHYFQQTQKTSSLDGCTGPVPLGAYQTCSDPGAGQYGVYQLVAALDGLPANSGTIRSGVTILSLGITYHIR